MTPTEPLRSTVAALLPDDDPDFGWIIHAPRAGDHLLLTCEVSEFWQAMPSQAVRSAIAQRVRRWADALAPTLGVVPWGRGEQDEVLIVAVSQEVADVEAKLVIAYLADLNPPPPAPPAPPACGCPEHGWHLITCPLDARPIRQEVEAA